MEKKVRVRFAPSPTGYLHVGGLRTALYNYLYARNTKGSFILRIEDTDRSRYVKGAVESLLNTLTTVGLDFDEGPYYQSERTEIYQKYANTLLEMDAAYKCFCTAEDLDKIREEQRAQKLDPRYDGRCRKLTKEEIETRLSEGKPYVIRAKMPLDGNIEFYDLVRDTVSFLWSMVDDQILIKSDGYPTYHLANVVDDHEMGITHIIRGEEWLTSTPKHVFLYHAFGWDIPTYAHLPLLLNPDKSKLSKRQGDVAVEDFLAKGYLPEALLNYVALLGWHSTEDREIYSLSELEQEFGLGRISKAGAVFDIEKLNWMNGYYIRSLDDRELASRVKKYFQEADISIDDEKKFLKIVAYAKERITLLPDIVSETEMFYKELDIKDNKLLTNPNSQAALKLWVEELEANEDINEAFISSLLNKTTQLLGIKGKHLYFPLRLALYGKEHGPNIPQLFDLLGTQTAIERLKKQIL